MNKFYKTNIILQWAVATLMFFGMLIILYFWIEIVSESKPGILLIFFIVPIIQFLITPLFTLIGLYKYLSPMLVVFAPNSRAYDLHNGTSFDYLMVMTNIDSGIQFRKKMFEYYLDGLLTIIGEIETKKLSSNVVVRGSSYFLSASTIARLGFQQSRASFPEKLNIVLNYIDLIWMYSLSSGKLTFPKLKNIKTVSITGERLMENKQELLALRAYIGKNKTIHT